MALFSNRLVVTDAAGARAAATAGAPTTRPLEVRVADATLLRALSVPRTPARVTRDLTLVVEDWTPPVTGWRGRPGNLSDADSFEIRYDRPRRVATARVRFDKDFPVSVIVGRLLGAFTPTPQISGAGFARVAFDEQIGDDIVRLLGRHPAESSDAPPRVLAGVGLESADVIITDTERAVDPSQMVTVVGVERSVPGGVSAGQTHGRREVPLVDLAVHNPIGRVQQFDPETRAAQLRIDNSALWIDIEAAPASEPSSAPEPIRAPLSSPVARAVVRRLVDVEAVSLAQLTIDPAATPFAAARLAELAATGAILHSMPASAGGALADLDPELTALLMQPYEPTWGLTREQRSVAQRRIAMRSHSGFLHLVDRVARATDTRMLPRVSIVLSTIRPQRVSEVMTLLLAQSYPEVELVLALHGYDAATAAQFERFTATGRVKIISRPASQPFGSVLADAVRASTGDLVLKADDDDWYSPEVVWDLVLAYLYSGADVVGKTTEYLYFERIDQTVHRTFATERYHRQLAGGAMMLPRGVLDSLGGWRPTRHSTDRSVLLDVFRSGGIGYRTHGLGYLYIRHDDGHTWVRSESKLLENSFEQWRGMIRPEVVAVAQEPSRLPE